VDKEKVLLVVAVDTEEIKEGKNFVYFSFLFISVPYQ
jgi:hypothetical protein